MYAFKNLLDKHPQAISEALRQVIAVLVVFQVVKWTDAQIVVVIGAVSVVLALFVASKTVNKAELDEAKAIQDEAEG